MNTLININTGNGSKDRHPLQNNTLTLLTGIEAAQVAGGEGLVSWSVTAPVSPQPATKAA